MVVLIVFGSTIVDERKVRIKKKRKRERECESHVPPILVGGGHGPRTRLRAELRGAKRGRAKHGGYFRCPKIVSSSDLSCIVPWSVVFLYRRIHSTSA